MKLSIDQRDEFAKLVVASRLADRRRALCIRMGLNPNTLDFLSQGVAFDFALELIADCEEKELEDALLRLLGLVTEELRNSRKHRANIAELYKALGRDFPFAEDEPRPQDRARKRRFFIRGSEPPRHSRLHFGNYNEGNLTDTHIVSVLQIWSPIVFAWMFLLFLVPTRYEAYIQRFRASTARNIHISLCCLLTYLPLVIPALGADLKYISISGNGLNWYRTVWLAVAIAWLVTMVVGRIDSHLIGDAIGLIIGTLVSIIFVTVTPVVFDLPLGILNWICISFTGGTAYAVATSTINDRNVLGAGIGAVISAVLAGITLAIFTGQIVGGIFVILTVVGAMAVNAGVGSALDENINGHRTSKRGVFTLVVYFVSLAALFNAYIDVSTILFK